LVTVSSMIYQIFVYLANHAALLSGPSFSLFQLLFLRFDFLLGWLRFLAWYDVVKIKFHCRS